MGVTITYGGTVPSLNDPATFNDRAIALFNWIVGTGSGQLLGELADMDAADFFSVQSSISDTTAGRLMLNGAHGIGATSANPPPVLTFATALTVGVFSVGAGDADKPWSASVGGIVTVTRTGASWVRQVATPANAADVYERFTTDNGATWSAWRRRMEYGSNANGEFIRFGNGVQICWLVFQGDTAGAETITWPAAFSATPRVLAAAGSSAASRSVTYANLTTTSVDLHIWDSSNVRTNSFAGLGGLGRWF